MESTSAYSSTGTSPHATKELPSDTNGTSNQNDNSNHHSEDRDSRSESLFESRGNLDTLAAAALKPLGDGASYKGRPHTPSYQQQRAHTRVHSPHLEQDEGLMHGANDDRSLRYHYREHGQQLTDEDSGDGPSSHGQNRNSQQGERGRSPSSHHPSQSPHGLYGQEQSTKANTRSTMSISSLLGEASSASGPIQKAAGNEIRPQNCSTPHGDDSDSDGRTLEHQHRHHHHHHHDQTLQQHSGDMMHHHHHHRLTHPHHLHHSPTLQHSHGHLHHHHPSHHVHQHGHQHSTLPHHRHHHLHHHHLRQGGTSTGSAFSYTPRSLGLRLNPKLKVNATQVYISYLIQLDQMQRAQHLMRSSEKRKSMNDSLLDSTGHPSHKHHQHSHVRAFSSGEPCRGAQPSSQREDRVERISGRLSPSSGTQLEQERHETHKAEDADMNTGEGTQSEAVSELSDRTSPQISRQGQGHLHSHPQHQHQHQHSHGHAHAHLHAHHSAPVLPAHIHPAQHHHHIVPVTSKADRGAAGRTNGLSTVHRHHVLHHHHPHHHPYHPNHPNHQHHFHHHAYNMSHGHSHGHNHHAHGHGHTHGHTHGHVHHAHPHGYSGHIHTHAHSHSPSHPRDSSTLERSHRERILGKKRSRPLLALPPAPTTVVSITEESRTLSDTRSDGDASDNGHDESLSAQLQQQDRDPSASPEGQRAESVQTRIHDQMLDRAESVSAQDKVVIPESEDSHQVQGADPSSSPLPPPSPLPITSTPFIARSESAMAVD